MYTSTRCFRPATTILLLSILLGGCATTVIQSAELHKKVQSLLETNTRPITLQVNGGSSLEHVGNQYVFFLIPFGGVTIEDSTAQVAAEAVTQLALSGYRPVLKSATATRSHNLQNPQISISILETQLTAYDLFLTRRLYSHITLSGTLTDRHGNLNRSEVSSSKQTSYNAFAFERELTHLHRKSLNQAMRQLLEKLRLTT